MGKIVVIMFENCNEFVFEVICNLIVLWSDGVYFFVGGLGGLGCVIIIWFVEKGVRYFVFLFWLVVFVFDYDFFVFEFEVLGCMIVRVLGDVFNYEDVLLVIKVVGRLIVGVL